MFLLTQDVPEKGRKEREIQTDREGGENHFKCCNSRTAYYIGLQLYTPVISYCLTRHAWKWKTNPHFKFAVIKTRPCGITKHYTCSSASERNATKFYFRQLCSTIHLEASRPSLEGLSSEWRIKASYYCTFLLHLFLFRYTRQQRQANVFKLAPHCVSERKMKANTGVLKFGPFFELASILLGAEVALKFWWKRGWKFQTGQKLKG